ncbi:EAL domain-containing protein [Caulobacter sp. DWR2-3-1b2]|uniref:EAL domain-containing protein n=1 Tax=Caulobacter sp. DWR2-3-1b2 TaxID=2804642 RepID=UPI003CEDD70D
MTGSEINATEAMAWPEAAPRRTLGLTAALTALATGQIGVRLCAGDTHNPEVEAFNALAERLDRLGPVLPPASKAPTSFLELESFEAVEAGQSLYVAIVGIDGFSRLRRQLGSSVAALLLNSLSARLRAHMPNARIGRVGRTNLEFAFPAAGDAEAERALLMLRPILEDRYELESGQAFDLNMALGLAGREACGEFVIECAAEALAHAQSQLIKVALYRDEDRARSAASLSLLRDLRCAIEEENLSLVYQPKLSLADNKVRVVEALVRWRHETLGMVSPDRFVTLAEETGLIGDLTRWVVRTAIADQARLAASDHALSIHVNLSGQMVADDDFAAWLLAEISRIPSGALGLEITETAVIDEPEKALRNLQAFADAGLVIAIDDYGSGLSSLAYLKQLPAHELKIDKLFISQLTSSHRDPLLVRSTIDLAHALGMAVTAEGVEDAMTLALLRMMGCDMAQGYLVSHPIALSELMNFMDKGDHLPSSAILPLMFKVNP